MKSQKDMPEMLTIRPPSEWRSLLVRVTRGCKWNCCRFCGIYPALGQPNFSIRTVAEVKHDIDLLRLLRPSAETAFFGDADPLEVGVDAFSEIAVYLRQVFSIKRLTCYARASTLYRLKEESIHLLARAGLNRVHIGLESGDPETLRFQRKGLSPKMVRQVSQWLKQAGIEISFYVLLGLGGRDHWQQHIEKTAALINEIEPEFVRIRRLWLYGDDTGIAGAECPLWREIRAGSFIPQTAEGSVLEMRLLLACLDRLSTFVACDHQNNYVNVTGTLKEDRDEMLAEIDSFLALPGEERQAHYKEVGSRI
ncbi:MAG: radical SAM protein [Thermodesulfobacteriota bacterium]|nr:radical SAM protein [Thermodesulfobacteriota bacterium]